MIKPTEAFMQFKGTDICLDIRCCCGALSHIDGFIQPYVMCPACGQQYELSPMLSITGSATATDAERITVGKL